MSLFGLDTERKDLDLFDPRDRTGVLIEGETGIGCSPKRAVIRSP